MNELTTDRGFASNLGNWRAWFIFFFDKLSMGVCTSSHYQTSGRLVQEIYVFTVVSCCWLWRIKWHYTTSILTSRWDGQNIKQIWPFRIKACCVCQWRTMYWFSWRTLRIYTSLKCRFSGRNTNTCRYGESINVNLWVFMSFENSWDPKPRSFLV